MDGEGEGEWGGGQVGVGGGRGGRGRVGRGGSGSGLGHAGGAGGAARAGESGGSARVGRGRGLAGQGRWQRSALQGTHTVPSPPKHPSMWATHHAPTPRTLDHGCQQIKQLVALHLVGQAAQEQLVLGLAGLDARLRAVGWARRHTAQRRGAARAVAATGRHRGGGEGAGQAAPQPAQPSLPHLVPRVVGQLAPGQAVQRRQRRLLGVKPGWAGGPGRQSPSGSGRHPCSLRLRPAPLLSVA